MTPNPFIKQYLMTAGPTPVPPAVSQAMAAPMLYHRAPAFDELYERVLAQLPHVFRTQNDVLAFAASGSGALESAVANLVRPGDKVLACAAGKFGERWIGLGEAYGAELVRYEPGWGERLDPAEIDRLLTENDGHRGRRSRRSARPRPASSTTSRRSPTVVRAPRRDPRRRRRLGPRRRRAAPGRLGRRRRRRRLAEGADVPARARVRVGVRSARSSTPSRGAGGRYYFDWGKTAKSQRKGASPFTPAVSLFLGLDVALGLIEEEGLETCCARHADARPRHPRRRRRARPRAVRRPRRALDRRHRGRAAGRRRRRQGPGRAAQARHHRQRRPGPPQGPDPADRPLRLLRRVRHRDLAVRAWRWCCTQLGREVEHGAGVGAAQKVFLEAGVPAAA